MKLLYFILLVLALVCGILTIIGVPPFFSIIIVLCISLSIPQLFDPGFDLVLFFESCGQ